MNASILKISITTGIPAALAILLFQVSKFYLVYEYDRTDYYVFGVAIAFLITGLLIKNNKAAVHRDIPAAQLLLNLTLKEQSVLRLIIEGKSNKEIASINYVEVSTVKTHINNIYNKLNVQSRREAVNKFKCMIACV